MHTTRILVVDDELELQRLVEQRFRKKIQSGYLNFTFASNGIEALHQLQQDNQIDMVLTDINMPEMDGLTFIHHLSQISETLKAVVISAHDDMTCIRQAMNEGAFDFLTKPIDFQDLERTIEKTLQVVRQLKAKQQKVQEYHNALCQVAFQDGLTGLPNRVWLYNYLEHLLKRRESLQNSRVALLFIDLDGFKSINDRLGHLAGDLLLKQIAQRLKLCLRKGDLAARLGGDEFVIVLEKLTDISVAVAVADRVQMLLAQPIQLEDQEIMIGASIGIALGDQKYQRPEDFLQAADMAMYSAKYQGKGRHAVYSDISVQNYN